MPGIDRIELENAVCTACGTLCDDIQLRFQAGKVIASKNACPQGTAWLESLRPLRVEAMVCGRAVEPEAALTAAAAALTAATAPIIVGLSGLGIEALRSAVALAEALGARLFPWPEPPRGLAASGRHAPESSATFGEVRGTADLVVLWGADLAHTHPRFVERHADQGSLLEGGVRTLCAIDGDLETARKLRLLCRQEKPLPGRPDQEAATSIHAKLQISRHAHFLLGAGVAANPALWDELQLLAAEVRRRHRITVSAIPGPGNSRGVVEVITWLAGRPPEPRRLREVLTAQACDLALVACPAPGSPAIPFGDAGAVERIVIGPDLDPTARVSLRVPGLDPRLRASVVRADGIHLTLCGGGPGAADPSQLLLQELGRLASQKAGPAPR